MRRLIVLAVLLWSVSAFAQNENWFPEPSQNPNAAFRLFRTKNIYTMLKLDTRTGQIWQVQWSNSDAERFTVALNRIVLLPTGTSEHPTVLKPGRFTLTPTANIFNFILIDEEDGRTWQVQWGDEKERLILPIP